MAKRRSRGGDLSQARFRQAVCASATTELPEHVDGWERLAVLQVAMGLRRDAVETFVRASEQFSGKRTLDIAVRMLTHAFEIEPWDFRVSMLLAEALRRSVDRAHAKQILEERVERAVGPGKRKVRAARFKTAPSPAAAWRWMVAGDDLRHFVTSRATGDTGDRH